MADENVGSGVKWNKVALLVENGTVNVDSTMTMLRAELVAYLASSVEDTAGIAEAVDSVFARMPQAESKLIDLNSLALKAFGSMTIASGKETKMLENIKNYIRAESKVFEATGGEAGRVWIVRGANGGVRNSTPATIEKFKALKAKKASDTIVL
jgi:hypothetical protein